LAAANSNLPTGTTPTTTKEVRRTRLNYYKSTRHQIPTSAYSRQRHSTTKVARRQAAIHRFQFLLLDSRKFVVVFI